MQGGVVVLSEHEASVVEAATARLIPGPGDDPGEAGHPGAREANVVGYISTMLAALDGEPPRVFAGGPFSDRAGGAHDDMEQFIELDEIELTAWTTRLAQLRQQYSDGIRALDAAAGGDFTQVTPDEQDAILAANPEGFRALLMNHAIEGMYSNPEYGGNAALVGWREIGFPGDTQPRGHPDAGVAQSEGRDPLDVSGVVEAVLGLLSFRAVAED